MAQRYYHFKAVLCFLFLACSLLASAEIYQWKDASGKVHFSDKKPENLSARELQPRVNSIPAVEISLPPAAADTATPAGKKSVTMYSTQRCGYCKKARAYFRKAGIAYREHDIDASESARRNYDKAGGRGVPLIFIGKARMDGFSQERFDWLYKQ